MSANFDKIPFLVFSTHFSRIAFLLSCTFFSGLTCSDLVAQRTVGSMLNDSLAWQGYTLLVPSSSTETYLIDNCGHEIRRWSSDYTPGLSAYLLADGSLIRTGRIPSFAFTGGGLGGIIERYDWDGNLIWSYEYANSLHHQHHDISVMPNGNILMLAWDYWSEADALAAGRDEELVDSYLWAESVVELEPSGTDEAIIVWRWSIKDHLIQNRDAFKPNYGNPEDHPERIDINYMGTPVGSTLDYDWTHANSIDYNSDRDEILLSIRNFSELWILDHSTTTLEAASTTGGLAGRGGDLLYRWGNPEVYDVGTALDQQLFSQHDAHWIPNGLPDGGRIMVYNNGNNRPGVQASSIDLLTPPLDASGQYVMPPGFATAPATSFRVYPAVLDPDFFSLNVSGAQRQPNGNTLICEGIEGHLFEVNAAGEIVWDYVNPVGFGGPVAQGNPPFSNSVFRTYRYAADYPGIEGRDLVAGELIELDPLPDECTLYPVQAVGVHIGQLSNALRVFPNPYHDQIWLQNPHQEWLRVRILDCFGRILVFSETTSVLSAWSSLAQVPWIVVQVQDTQGHIGYWKLLRDPGAGTP